jgi:hypothetical protein
MSFQYRVGTWVVKCFGVDVGYDKIERNQRFLEESLELVQSLGCSRSEAHQLVDYVFGRPLGEPKQEVGGVMVTLAALCNANEIDIENASEEELARIWTVIDKIREKQKKKVRYVPGVSRNLI